MRGSLDPNSVNRRKLLHRVRDASPHDNKTKGCLLWIAARDKGPGPRWHGGISTRCSRCGVSSLSQSWQTYGESEELLRRRASALQPVKVAWLRSTALLDKPAVAPDSQIGRLYFDKHLVGQIELVGSGHPFGGGRVEVLRHAVHDLLD